jgi:hypothetical protein
MSYESVSVDGCEESGEESEELSEECEQSSEEERLSVCEQLAADLRAVGILPAAKETQGAASGCRPQ